MHLVEPGDEIVMMVPNYMQSRGVARALGATVRPWPLVRDDGARPRWRPDLERLASLVSDRTKAVLICNPNNPTGARMTAAELDAVGRAADRVGAVVIADEVYRGAEHDGVETPTMWGRAERVLITSGVSKAYGLPGLRIGWVAGPPEVVDALWGLRDYTTIAAGALSDWLARAALAPATRRRLLERTRGILNHNHAILRAWIDERAPALDHIATEAGAIAFVRYRHPINSRDLAERLRVEQSVLVVPGDYFDMDGYLRIGFGYDAAILSQGLHRVGTLLDSVQPAPLSDAR
jgi:aspartate/methionine/tyrosine aminotransferase